MPEGTSPPSAVRYMLNFASALVINICSIFADIYNAFLLDRSLLLFEHYCSLQIFPCILGIYLLFLSFSSSSHLSFYFRSPINTNICIKNTHTRMWWPCKCCVSFVVGGFSWGESTIFVVKKFISIVQI